MERLTISLPDDLLRWLRDEARAQGTTASRFIADLLHDRMTEAERRAREDAEREAAYEEAMRSFLSRPPQPLKTSGRYPTREELYDRDADRWPLPPA